MTNIEKIYKAFEVSENDISLYKSILKKVKSNPEQKVLSHFMKNYVYRLNSKFTRILQSVLGEMLRETVTKREITQGIVRFNLSSKYYKQYLTNGYRKIAGMLTGSFFDRYSIADAELRKSIREDVYGQFDNFIKTSMSQTDRDVLKHIRTLQREIIQRNLKKSGLEGVENIDQIMRLEKKNFKKNMLKKYPDLAKQFEDGKVLKSRAFVDQSGTIKVRSYTLDAYTDFSIQGTILNMDTTLGEVDAQQNGDRVVEFYLKDNRKLKTKPFPYCQKIIKKKIAGRSILALDDQAASVLNIPTVATAKSNYSLAPLRGCRHSIRRIKDVSYINKINKILYVAEAVGG
jgi:hypothetical protein